MQRVHFYLYSLFCVGMFLPQVLFAHATPITYTPASQATVREVPTEVVIDFTERIEPAASSITVYGPGGEEVQEGALSVSDEDPRQFAVPLRDRGDGVYTVSWQVVSADDGHFTKGAYAFLVDPHGAAFEGTAGQVQIQHLTSIPEAVLSFFNLLGQALFVSAVLVLLFVLKPHARRAEGSLPGYQSRYTKIVVLGLLLTVLATASYIVLKTFDLGQLRGLGFVDTLPLFLASNAGVYALMRIAAALIALTVFAAFRARIYASTRATRVEWVLLAIAFLIIVFQARVSHAAASHLLPVLSIGVTALHLFFKEILVGGIAALLCLGRKNDQNIVRLMKSYSQMILIPLGVAGVTGIFITWLHLKDSANLFTTEWGGRFVILAAFGFLFVALRFLNHWLLFKVQIQKLALLLGAHVLEFLIGLVILFFSGYISITTPPIVVEGYRYEAEEVKGGVTTTLAPNTSSSGEFLVRVEGPDGFAVKDITVLLTEEKRGIGPLVPKVEETFEGGFVFSMDELSPPGMWDIRTVVTPVSGYDVISDFRLNYPEDIIDSAIDPEARDIDRFFWFCAALIVVISIGLVVLFRATKQIDSEEVIQTSDGSPISQRAYWVSAAFAFGASVVLVATVWFGYGHVFKSEFQKKCETDGHFWLQSAPMHNGETTSPNTVTGCTLNLGLYHFGTEEEYDYYFKDSEARSVFVQMRINPEEIESGVPTDLAFVLSWLRDGEMDGAVQNRDLVISHDRKIHTLIIGEDLEYFAHVHPEDSGPRTEEMQERGEYSLTHTFPKAGRYTVLLDYVVQGKEIRDQFFVEVAGSRFLEDAEIDTGTRKAFGEYVVTFEKPDRIVTGEEVEVAYTIEKDGVPVTDLEPYLAAAMHLGIVRSDLRQPSHTHGELALPGSSWFQRLFRDYIETHAHFVPSAFGPRVYARMRFDTPGTYQIFGEFKHAGKVVVTDFVIEVTE